MARSPPRTALLTLALLAGVALAGCVEDAPPALEARLLSEATLAELGLHHCVVSDEMRQMGIPDNPGQLPPHTFQDYDDGPTPVEVWAQILAPVANVPCEELDAEETVFVMAAAFETDDDVLALLEDEEACTHEEAFFIGGRHAVGAEGGSTQLRMVGEALKTHNPDLYDPCV